MSGPKLTRKNLLTPPSPYQDPRTWKMTPAMQRMRRPYLLRNVILFSVLAGVSLTAYYYTYKMLRKDLDFDDVPIPPVDEKELAKLKAEYEKSS